MTESPVHCAIEFDDVLSLHYQPFVVIEIVDRLRLEPAPSTYELTQVVWSIDDAIRFVEI